MIVRILEEGQYDVPDDRLDELNVLDERLANAVDRDDAASFADALAELLAGVRQFGAPVPDDFLGPSDLVLPGDGSSVDEVKAMLTEEGLIPG
jgi:PspAA-like protein